MHFHEALEASSDGVEQLARGPSMVLTRIQSLESLASIVWRQERVMCGESLKSRIRDPGGDSKFEDDACGAVAAARGCG